MKEVKTANDLSQVGNRCVNVNIEYLNYMYYIFITMCAYNETVYSVFNKYIKIKFEDEYITHRHNQYMLMNPTELKILVDYTNAEQYLEKYVKVSKKSLVYLAEEHTDIDDRFNMKRAKESGNVIKACNVNMPVQPQVIPQSNTEQNLIDQIAAANNNQSKVSDIVAQAKGLTLK